VGLLRTRRGIGLLAFATFMSVACVLLGLWQLDRYQQRGERNEAVRTALEAQPVTLDSLVPANVSSDDLAERAEPGLEWRSVVVRGTFEPEVLALRLRPVDGQSGVHALGLLSLEDGRTVIVDRGFSALMTRSTDSVDLPAPPRGPVQLVGRVRLSESGRGSGLDADANPASIRFVDVDDLGSLSAAELAPVWLERVEQTPPEDAALAPIPTPRLSSGPSLIYAVQWFLFAVIAVVGFVVLARRDNEQSPTPAEASGGAGADEVSPPTEAVSPATEPVSPPAEPR
jgi:cytochrome oxidase assembly protein ShyY1